jgi:hypothetical protein
VDTKIPSLRARHKGEPPATVGGGYITPSRRGSVTLPKCRGCGREHQVKMRRLYLLDVDGFRNGDDIYVGD